MPHPIRHCMSQGTDAAAPLALKVQQAAFKFGLIFQIGIAEL